MKIKILSNALLTSALLHYSNTAFANIPLGKNANQSLVLTGSDIAFVAGHHDAGNNIASLQKIDFKTKTAQAIELPSNALLYSYGSFHDTKNYQAVVMTSDGVYLVNEEQPKLLIAAKSLYSDVKLGSFKQHQFTVESNDDGLTDIFLPGFAEQTLFQQKPDGSFTKLTIPYQAEIATLASNDEVSVSFELPSKPLFIDINGDDKLDAVFTNTRDITYLVATDLGFEQPLQLKLAINNTDAKADSHNVEKEIAETIEVFSQLRDFNQDGLVDLFTKVRSKDYQPSMSNQDDDTITKIYLSRRVNNVLTFDDKAITQITLPGTSNIIAFPNLNGDNFQELAILEVDIGITDIISIASAVASREAVELDVEIQFYRGLTQNSFSEDAEVTKDFELKMDMEEGPPKLHANMKDFNGDGKTDLLLRY